MQEPDSPSLQNLWVLKISLFSFWSTEFIQGCSPWTVHGEQSPISGPLRFWEDFKFRDYCLKTLSTSLSIRQNWWNQTLLSSSRWLPRSPPQTRNELYHSCCLQGKGDAAAASCKRGHWVLMFQTMWAIKMTLKVPLAIHQSAYQGKSIQYILLMIDCGVPAILDAQLYRPWNISNASFLFSVATTTASNDGLWALSTVLAYTWCCILNADEELHWLCSPGGKNLNNA